MVLQLLRHENDCNTSCNLSSAQETAIILASPWYSGIVSRTCVATQASSDHPHWCGPHPVSLSFALALGCRRSYPPQNSDCTIFAGFYTYVPRLESEALYSTFLTIMTIAFIT